MDRCIEAMASLAEQVDQPMLHWTVAYARTTQALIAGDQLQAEALAIEALQLGNDSGQPDAIVFFALQSMAANFQKGTLLESIPLIEQMANEVTVNGYLIKAGLIIALAQNDRTDEVRMLLEEFSDTGFDFLLDCSWAIGLCGCAEGAITLGDPRFAAPLFDLLAPWSAQYATTGVTGSGPISHYVGALATVLGRFDEADTYFAQAASMCSRARAKFFAARTDLWWGKMLATRRAPGDVERAQKLLTGAYEVASARGYATVERRSLAALQLLHA
jgi:hypothetical protein